MPEPDERREPIVREKTMIASVGATAVDIEFTVDRGLNGVRLAVLGILVGIGLTVGFGVPGPVWVGAVAGAGSFVAACFLIRSKPSRRRLMSFMHWLTDL